METVEYFKTKRRMLKTDNDGMCTINCSTCGLSKYNNGMNIGCCAFEYLCPEKAVAIVEQWAKEHPLRTYAKDFFEKFPDAEKDYDSCPCTCRKLMYGEESTNCERFNSCIECWNSPMEEYND